MLQNIWFSQKKCDLVTHLVTYSLTDKVRISAPKNLSSVIGTSRSGWTEISRCPRAGIWSGTLELQDSKIFPLPFFFFIIFSFFSFHLYRYISITISFSIFQFLSFVKIFWTHFSLYLYLSFFIHSFLLFFMQNLILVDRGALVKTTYPLSLILDPD